MHKMEERRFPAGSTKGLLNLPVDLFHVALFTHLYSQFQMRVRKIFAAPVSGGKNAFLVGGFNPSEKY